MRNAEEEIAREKEDAKATFDVFSSFVELLGRNLPFSMFEKEARVTMASHLIVAYETRRSRRATEELLEVLAKGKA